MKKAKWLNKRRWQRYALRQLSKRPGRPSRLRFFKKSEEEILVIGKTAGQKPVRTLALVFPTKHLMAATGQNEEPWPPPVYNPFEFVRNLSALKQFTFLLAAVWLGRPHFQVCRILNYLLP